ncbi:hypothetical protein LX36DRAFT_439741 [Colletotrichum falcatum]|nr:hypothetical protein LX36DRAFT_439741 [Colletotrichum falcatum]
MDSRACSTRTVHCVTHSLPEGTRRWASAWKECRCNGGRFLTGRCGLHARNGVRLAHPWPVRRRGRTTTSVPSPSRLVCVGRASRTRQRGTGSGSGSRQCAGPHSDGPATPAATSSKPAQKTTRAAEARVYLRDCKSRIVKAVGAHGA